MTEPNHAYGRPLGFRQRKAFRFGQMLSDAELSTLGAMSGIEFKRPEAREVLFKMFEAGMQFANDQQAMEAEGAKPPADNEV